MNGSTDDHQRVRGRDRWIGPLASTAADIRLDLRHLHGHWMGLAFPRPDLGNDAVTVRRGPDGPLASIAYRLWGVAGVLVVSSVYVLTVLGYAVRFYSRRIDRTAASLGLVGVVAVSVVAWAALGTVAFYSAIPYRGFVAVVTAGVVATVSAALAYRLSRTGGRVTTVALAYPFGVTAIFLPPVVAALNSPTLAAVVFPESTTLAIWILDTLLAVGGINAFIRATFELEGLAYVGMWFALAVPVGWLLGLLVSLPGWVRAARPRRPGDVAASWSGDHGR